MELVALSNPWLVIRERTRYHDLVDNDSVVVDLCKAIGLFQVVEAYFVIKWYVVTFSSSCNSNYNILDTCVAMHKADVVVEQEDIRNQLEELDQESNEKTDEAGVLHPCVVVIKLHQVTVLVLIRQINYNDQEEIKHRSQTIPSNELAELRREAQDQSLREVANGRHE